MLTIVIAKDVNDAFIKLCEKAVTWPIEIRRGDVKMMDSPGPVIVEIENPRARVLNVLGRNNSLPATCAETLWILAGRSDVDWLKFYLPRAPDFSDDGQVWRAGYGPRLRNWVGISELPDSIGGEVDTNCVDQIKFIIDELSALPNSRRAAVSLIDPSQDLVKAPVTYKDFPCNLTLSFMIRDGKLDLVVFCRSQDLIWGASGINWFEFTVMQELIASILKVSVGSYYHVTNNLHVYNRHFNMVKKITENGYNNYDPLLSSSCTDYRKVYDLKEMDDFLKDFFAYERMVRAGVYYPMEREVLETKFFADPVPTLLTDMAMVVFSYCSYRLGDKAQQQRTEDQIYDEAMAASFKRHIELLEVQKQVKGS